MSMITLTEQAEVGVTGMGQIPELKISKAGTKRSTLSNLGSGSSNSLGLTEKFICSHLAGEAESEFGFPVTCVVGLGLLSQ